MTDKSPVTLADLTPYNKIPEEYPELFSPKSWKWKVKQRKHNGLAKAFRKVGKDLYVNKRILAECIDEQLDD